MYSMYGIQTEKSRHEANAKLRLFRPTTEIIIPRYPRGGDQGIYLTGRYMCGIMFGLLVVQHGTGSPRASI